MIMTILNVFSLIWIVAFVVSVMTGDTEYSFLVIANVFVAAQMVVNQIA